MRTGNGEWTALSEQLRESPRLTAKNNTIGE